MPSLITASIEKEAKGVLAQKAFPPILAILQAYILTIQIR